MTEPLVAVDNLDLHFPVGHPFLGLSRVTVSGRSRRQQESRERVRLR